MHCTQAVVCSKLKTPRTCLHRSWQISLSVGVNWLQAAAFELCLNFRQAIRTYRPRLQMQVVVDIDGDGSFLMNCQELATIFIEKLDVKCFIMNNQHLGMVVQWEDRFYKKNRAHTYLGHRVSHVTLYMWPLRLPAFHVCPCRSIHSWHVALHEILHTEVTYRNVYQVYLGQTSHLGFNKLAVSTHVCCRSARKGSVCMIRSSGLSIYVVWYLLVVRKSVLACVVCVSAFTVQLTVVSTQHFL